MKQQLFVLKNNNILVKYFKSIATLFVVAVLFLSCGKNDIQQIKSFSHPEGAPEMIAENYELLHSDSTVITFKLNAPILRVYDDEKEPYKEFPDGFRVLQFDKNQKISSDIKADYGKYFEKKKLWEAKQNVVAVTRNGDTLKTEILYWDEKKDIIYSDEYVKIIQEDKNITGIGFKSDLQMNEWVITKPRGPLMIEVEEDNE